MCLLFSVVFILGLLASANPVLSPYRIHERRGHIPAGWSYHQKHDSSAAIPLRFGLKQNNIDAIGDYLMEVSHPESENFGKHWTAGEVFRKFSPSTETIGVVRAWLEESGFDSSRTKLTRNRGWIEVKATVEEAERLLQTEYHVYSHETGQKHVACGAYHLPEHVQRHIDFVTPTVHFDAKIKKRSGSTDGVGRRRTVGQPGSVSHPKTSGQIQTLLNDLDDCDKQITPMCLRALYGLVYEPVAASKNSYGIVEYTPEAYLQSDLDIFHGNFSDGLVGVSPYLVSIDGGYVQMENVDAIYNGESDLDLEYAMNLVTANQTVTLYQVGDMVENTLASFNNFLDAIDGTYCTYEGGDDPTQDGIYPDPFPGGYNGPEDCGTAKPTNVISTSYGHVEADLTPFYIARQCSEYAKLGLMGVTILYASGDDGVAGFGYCLTNGTSSVDGTIFNPMFPGTCPYITSVGATQVNPGSTVDDPEGASEQVVYSGGGFSNYFAMPDYQKTAVEYYLTNHYPNYLPDSQWNSSGTSRGYPDIAANGVNYVVAVDGEFQLTWGTSCSSPVSGAILTMVNDARLAVGKSPIGFINPTIYSSDFAGTLNDITIGGNPGCGTAGFTAVPGWDPVTGLGTPNFPKLVAKWLLLP